MNARIAVFLLLLGGSDRDSDHATNIAMCGESYSSGDWNGTWIGNWQGGDGLQLIMAGNDAVGIFWHGDYLPDELHASVSTAGKTLTITWAHGSAVLTRDGAGTAHIVIHEPGRKDAAFPVTLDH